MPTGTTIENLLLVEGPEDQHVIREIWLTYHKGSEVPFQIKHCDGIDTLLKQIGPQIKTEGRVTLGIIADANTDIMARRRSLEDRLIRANVTIPQWTADGVIQEQQDGPRIGLWLMPDNTNTGQLEDFLWAMIPENDPIKPLAVDYVDAVTETARRFKNTKRSRAEIHSWLAVQEEPRLTGRAIQAGDLDSSTELVARFVGWLERLFWDGDGTSSHPTSTAL